MLKECKAKNAKTSSDSYNEKNKEKRKTMWKMDEAEEDLNIIGIKGRQAVSKDHRQ